MLPPSSFLAPYQHVRYRGHLTDLMRCQNESLQADHLESLRAWTFELTEAICPTSAQRLIEPVFSDSDHLHKEIWRFLKMPDRPKFQKCKNYHKPQANYCLRLPPYQYLHSTETDSYPQLSRHDDTDHNSSFSIPASVVSCERLHSVPNYLLQRDQRQYIIYHFQTTS